MPTPLTTRSCGEETVNVNGLASPAKTSSFTSIPPKFEMEMLVVFESAKVAISAGPFGTVEGVQFAAVFQLPLIGLRFHVALPAWLVPALMATKKVSRRIRMMDPVFIDLASVNSIAELL